MHWLDGHSLLFERLARWLTADGILAVQMPHNHHAPSHQGIFETVYNGPWRDALLPLMREDPVGDMAFYWDILTGLGLSVDLWETEYLHVLHGENAVVEWTKSTALTPLLDALGEPDRRAFLRDYSCRMATAYPMREDGATLFPFKRLFLIARRMRATH